MAKQRSKEKYSKTDLGDKIVSFLPREEDGKELGQRRAPESPGVSKLPRLRKPE